MKEQSISPPLLEVINRVANKLGVCDFDIDLKPGNKKGEGFLGEIFFVNIHDKKKDEYNEIVVKRAFLDDTIRSSVPIRDSFMNEINFYSSIWPNFVKLQEQLNLKNKFNKVPRCILTSSNEKLEILVLENLKTKGFEVFDKTKILDDTHIKMIFEQYGRFHGLSFAYKFYYPEEYYKLEESTIDVFKQFAEFKTFNEGVTKMCKDAMDSLNPKTDGEAIKNFQKYVEDSKAQYVEGLDYKGKYSVITHGDCWSNNMMFKYDDSKEIADMALLDWQLCRKGTPVCDLSYCLYSGGDKESFDKLDDYLQVYYESFSTFLQELGCDPQAEFPLEALKDDWKKHAKSGMLISLSIIRMKLTRQEDIIDLTDLAETGMNVEDVKVPCDMEALYKRYRDLLVHLNKIGAL